MFSQSFFTHFDRCTNGNPSFLLSFEKTCGTLKSGIEVKQNALRFIPKCIVAGKQLDEKIINDIHALLMDNILTGGIYRTVEVRISGARHKPPVPSQMYQQIKKFYGDMQYRAEGNAVELAAWTHAEFVKIHPFVDRNVTQRHSQKVA